MRSKEKSYQELLFPVMVYGLVLSLVAMGFGLWALHAREDKVCSSVVKERDELMTECPCYELEERRGIMQHDGGLSEGEANHRAWHSMCPGCTRPEKRRWEEEM